MPSESTAAERGAGLVAQTPFEDWLNHAERGFSGEDNCKLPRSDVLGARRRVDLVDEVVGEGGRIEQVPFPALARRLSRVGSGETLSLARSTAVIPTERIEVDA